jgi:hypothetical protein
MTTRYRQDIAFPAELIQQSKHFASGVNAPGEVRGLALSGRNYGITANEIREGLIAELELFAGGLQELFVDSGAFSEVKFGPEGPKVVRPMTDADWDRVFDLYQWAATSYGPRARLVAPDRVGCQATTLARLATYAPQIAACAALRAQIIVPVQKGEIPMGEFFQLECAILNLRETPIAGIPMKKDATSMAELAEFVATLPWFGARIHLLGIGPSATRGKVKFVDVIALIKRIRPNADITSDSVTIRRLVGRSNGRGGAPRALTAAQDRARALGVTDPQAVKSAGLIHQGLAERDAELERANDAGWYDVELFDSVEEARAHHASCKADREPATAAADSEAA